jgi:hypothetical protein
MNLPGTRRRLVAAFGTALLVAVRAEAEDRTAPHEAAANAPHEASLSEVNKQLTNPVSSLWSITLQQNNFRVDPGPGENDRWSSNLLFQPVLPIGISPDWNLVTRPVIPLFVSTPRPDPVPGDPFRMRRSTAFGDIALMQLISPSPELVGSWLLGVGPTWMFPTAASDFTGSGKFQLGPAVLVGYLSDKWILGALFQNWWSIAGEDSRPDASSMNLQPVASYFLPDGWSIGYSGNILANWKNPDSETFTVPIGASVAKVVKLGKLPVRFALGVQWMPIQPDLYGQKWNVQLIVAPVLPKLIKGYLTEPGRMSVGLGR